MEEREPFQTLRSERFPIGRFVVVEDRVLVNGSEQPYDYVEIKPGVCILPIFRGAVVALREYRYPLRSWQWEFPGGLMDPGETPARAAVRELREEAGLVAKELLDLGVFYPSFGSTNETMYLFAALCEERAETAREPAELIAMEEFTPERFEQMIASGEFSHGGGIAAWTRYRLR